MVKAALLLTGTLSAACALAFSQAGLAAEAFPSKLVRIIVPATPGGGGDIIARQLAQKLNAAWGQQVIVDYRPGAGTVLGTALTAQAAPDGHTMVIVQTSYTINATLNKALPYDPIKDLAAVTQIAQQAHLVIVHPTLPVKSIRDLVVLAKSKPGQLNYGSSYTGSGGHLAGELFKTMTGTEMSYIPYKGTAPALVDLLSGQLQVMFATMFSSMGHMKSGRVRAIAVTTAKRAAALPQVPTVAEQGVPGFETSSWNGLLAPGGTPKPIVQRLSADVRKVLQSPDTREAIARDGGEVVASTPEEFEVLIKSEISKWARVIKARGIKGD
jgi:tripartite-type tricarboxylate transporter receptor subunit TctC